MFSNTKEKFVNFVIEKPKWSLLLFVLLNLAVVPGLLQLSSDFSYKSWYHKDDPKVKNLKAFERTFGNDDRVIILVHKESGILDKNALTAIQKLIDDIWKVTDIIRVDTLTNFQNIEALDDELIISDLISTEEIAVFNSDIKKKVVKKINSDPAIKGEIISNDLSSIGIVGILRPAYQSIPNNGVISNEIKDLLKSFRDENPDLKALYTGPVSVVHEFKEATIADISFLLPLLYSIFVLIIYLKYRSIMAIVLVFFTITASVLLMMGMSGYLNLTINSLTAASPTILMTIALSDAIHILSSFFLGLKNGMLYKNAVRYSMKRNFYPTLLTTLTTGLGFMSFYDAKVQSVADLGAMVAIGTVFAWLVTYLALGPFLLFSRRFFKKYIQEKQSESIGENDIEISKFGRVATKVLDQNKKSIIVVTLLSCFLCFSLILKLKVNMDPMEQFKPESAVVKASNFLVEKFSYKGIYDIVIDSGESEGAKDPKFLNDMEKFVKWILEYENTSKVKYIGDILKSINKNMNAGSEEYYKIPETRNMVAESLLLYTMGLPSGKDINNLINSNNRKIRMSVFNVTSDSTSSLKQIREIEEKGKEFGYKVTVTGKTPLFHELTPYIVTTFLKSFAIAVISITIVLILALKSIKLGLLTLIPNIFPLIIGGGVFYLFGYDVDVGTVLISSVCLGIAVDDSIHFLFEFKKNKDKGLSTYKTIETIFATTFPALLMTSLLISVGFASFIFGNYIPNIRFGAFSALILMIALIADFIILPAIMLFVENKGKKYE